MKTIKIVAALLMLPAFAASMSVRALSKGQEKG